MFEHQNIKQSIEEIGDLRSLHLIDQVANCYLINLITLLSHFRRRRVYCISSLTGLWTTKGKWSMRQLCLGWLRAPWLLPIAVNQTLIRSHWIITILCTIDKYSNPIKSDSQSRGKAYYHHTETCWLCWLDCYILTNERNGASFRLIKHRTYYPCSLLDCVAYLLLIQPAFPPLWSLVFLVFLQLRLI